MNFGIIGFGNIARKFVKSIEYTTTGKIYAIGSKSIDSKDEYLITHPDVKVYHDYDDLLADDNIEVIYIALPHYYHKEWIIKALNCHKAVLVEKPIVLNSVEIDEIKACVKANNGYCLEAFKTKFNDGFMALKEDLKLIGEIKSIKANFCNDATYFRKDSYLFDPKQGGALNDVGSYIIGFILGLVNSPISAIETNMHIEDEIELSFMTKINFQNGIVGIGEGSIEYNKERYALIKGTNGQIYLPNYNRIIDYTIDTNNQTIKRSFPIVGDDMTMEIQALIDDVNNNKNENEIHSLNDSKYLIETMEQVRKNRIEVSRDEI